MYPLTARGRAVQARSHRIAIRVEVIHGGRVVTELVGYVTGGSVNAETDRPIMRNLTLTIVDPDGTLSATDVGDLLSPYDAEIKPWRGVVTSSGVVNWVPLGVYRLTSTSVDESDEGLVVSFTGQDRALTYQTPLPGPVTVPAGTAVETAVQALLARVNGALQFRPWTTGRTVGPLLYESDTQAWDAALTLAESVGGWLFHDRDGVCVMAPYANTVSSSLLRFESTLLSVSRGEDADEIHNVVVVQSSESGSGVIRATAEDTNPDSPTYARGAYGRRQITVTNPHVGTPAQAVEAAQARLIQELGRSETVSWECVPDVQLDPGDVVTVHRPRAGVVNRRVVVAGVVLPLGVDGAMSVSARKSVITQAGAAL